MSELHLRHVKALLDNKFTSHLDLTDQAATQAKGNPVMALSRALSAFALASLAELTPEEAAAQVTDGFDDNGIDAIYFDPSLKCFFIVQAKWISSGRGAPSQKEVLALLHGFEDLTNLKEKRFNDRIVKMWPLLNAALEDPNVRFELILVHTGNQQLGVHAKRNIEDLVHRVNDPSELLTFRVLDLNDVHKLVAGLGDGAPIELTVDLHEWGVIEDPFAGYYGQVNAADVAAWWASYGARLFSRNLRHILPDSTVNEAIVDTVTSEPENFWYFNNGITVLCDSIKRAGKGAMSRRTGTFACGGVSIVNGAQTVGSIGEAARNGAPRLGDAWVSARFIQAASEFAGLVARATNTQNRIERRDFVSLDPNQDRLRRELALDGRSYAIKTGEPNPDPSNGCSVVDATIAIACSQDDPSYAVLAKREIGRLWEDISKPPYSDLFNANLTGVRLWNLVVIAREVDGRLRDLQASSVGRDRALVVHGNRLILHMVFRRLPLGSFSDPQLDITSVRKQAGSYVRPLARNLLRKIEELYPGSYLASLFKNASKCSVLANEVRVRPRKVGRSAAPVSS